MHRRRVALSSEIEDQSLALLLGLYWQFQHYEHSLKSLRRYCQHCFVHSPSIRIAHRSGCSECMKDGAIELSGHHSKTKPMSSRDLRCQRTLSQRTHLARHRLQMSDARFLVIPDGDLPAAGEAASRFTGMVTANDAKAPCQVAGQSRCTVKAEQINKG